MRLLNEPSRDHTMCPFADTNIVNTSKHWKPPFLLCAPGITNDTAFCGQEFLTSRLKRGKIKVTKNPYAAVIASDFCLEPPGDTPTRSHFYLVRMLFQRDQPSQLAYSSSTSHNSIADPCIQAIFAGCIPVIFDYECSLTSQHGLDFSNMQVSGCPRHMVTDGENKIVLLTSWK